MNPLIETLIDRLEQKGMARNSVPGFVRSVASTISGMPDMALGEVRRRLQSLGWDDSELDNYTLQLVIAIFQQEGLIEVNHKPISWFETTFNLNKIDKTADGLESDLKQFLKLD